MTSMRITLSLILALVFVLSSCAVDTPREKIQQLIAMGNELAGILEEVDDEESAKGNAEEARGLTKEIDRLSNELKQQRRGLDDAEKEDFDDAGKGLEGEIEKVENRLQKVVAGLKATDYGQKELGDVLSKIEREVD